jgi:hypothetical protein
MKIALVGDACSKPPIIIRFHDLHVGNIRGAMGEIISTKRRISTLSFFWFFQAICLLAFLCPSLFVSLVMVLAIDFLLDFCACVYLSSIWF